VLVGVVLFLELFGLVGDCLRVDFVGLWAIRLVNDKYMLNILK